MDSVNAYNEKPGEWLRVGRDAEMAAGRGDNTAVGWSGRSCEIRGADTTAGWGAGITASHGRPRVALGMSGGVDSSVSAALLVQEGYDVVGVTCVFFDDPSSQVAINDARVVAKALGIRHVVRDCRDMFERHVIQAFVNAYACGNTPSPCVGCNALVKIPALISAASEASKESGYPCDFVATGHYARIVRRCGRLSIARAANAAKDQSYMLAMLTQNQLSRLALPLGNIAGGKPEVRRIAAKLGLPTASKTDSQDICFIPDGDHRAFLDSRGVSGSPGDIVTRSGEVVGRHKGLFRYTVGQRKGLEIGGAPKPYYVVDKDAKHNQIVVAFGEDAWIDCVQVSDMNWQALFPEHLARRYAECGPLACSVKLRYRQKAAPCRLVPVVGGEGDARISPSDSCDSRLVFESIEGDIPSVTVLLDEPQTPTAPGQFAVFYDGDMVLGAGVIKSISQANRS